MEAPAVVENPGGNLGRWLFNPFYYIAGGRALVIGVGAILATGLLAFLGNVHFDGVLDFHFGPVSRAPMWMFLSEGLVSWLVMGILLLAGGMIVSSSRVRAQDVIGTQALARLPCLITALTGFLPGPRRFAQNLAASYLNLGTKVETYPLDGILFAAALLVAVLMTVWMVALMYRAFAVSCNLSGGKAVSVFFVALTLGETVSKVLLYYIY